MVLCPTGWQVSTKDGVLVARHGLTLDDSTDVASRPEFAARRRTQVGWIHAGCTLTVNRLYGIFVASGCTNLGCLDLISLGMIEWLESKTAFCQGSW